MKILIVASSLSSKNAGVTTSVLNYYKALKQTEAVKITLVSTLLPEEFEFLDGSIVNDENFLFFKTNSKRWRYSKTLNFFLKNKVQNYDIVWIHAIWLSHSYFASKYAIKYNIPYIITPHGLLNPYALKLKSLKKNIYWNIIEKHIFNKAAVIHCLTIFEKNQVQTLTDRKTFVLPNTIDPGVFESKNYDELHNICFIGHFHHIKGLDLLLNALKKIENIQLLIAGDGDSDYEEYIYGLVKIYGLKNKVKFFGFADPFIQKEIYRQSLFCVIPSHSEGLAMVGLESLSHSTPVLATAQCGFEIIEEYDGGMVIKNNSPKVIREGIEKMMQKDINKMSKHAHHLAKEHFDFEIVSKGLLEQFEALYLDQKLSSL